MKNVFDQTCIADIKMKNRFVRSATWEGMADTDGYVTDHLIDTMVDLAKGGIGCIISGHAFVHKTGYAGNGQLAIDHDECVTGLRKMVDAVHKFEVPFILQLSHGGAFIRSTVNKKQALAPSEISNIKNETLSKEMTSSDIFLVISSFGDAALRAKNAGCDGVQIHAAHGYLLSEFLSPYFNKRTDDYGGDIKNRSRIIVEIIRDIKCKVGFDYPILVKFNSEDFLENGFSVDDMIAFGKILEKEKITAVELSGGTLINPKQTSSVRVIDPSESEEGYYKEAAKQFKEHINIPLILVGGVRSLNIANQLIKENITDFISISRPLIREPELIKRWQSGDTARSTCISCNACFIPGLKGKGIYCVPERRLKNK